MVYHFISEKSKPILFNSFGFPLGLVSDIKNVKTDLGTVNIRQINFRLDLNKISKGNKNYKLKEQRDALNNIKKLYDAQ